MTEGTAPSESPTTMSTSSEPNSAPQQQQQQRVRKPPFADWPTIKILTPPQGRFSLKYDEWCFTYCSQTVSGRIHGREPNCRSLCFRKVFPHEIKNILSFKRHETVGKDGKAKYPLPSEGQADNLPRVLGGRQKDDSEDGERATPASTRYWDEGSYLWTGKGRWAGQQKMEQMMLDLAKQQVLDKLRENRKELWQEYQEQLQNTQQQSDEELDLPGAQWWGPLVPPKTLEDAGSPSILIPLPPDVPSLREKIDKLIAPSFRALTIFHDSVTSGEQKAFALRVWEKARSEEPFILAKRTIDHAYDQWKKRDESEEDDEKKGPE